jgi:hypothetical protein
MQNKSHLTALTRKKLPGPTQWLINQGLIVARDGWHSNLDYGCGKSHEINNAFFQADGYDPHFRPERPKGKYMLIICNYVLCVLPTEEERRAVLKDIQSLLTDNGTAYVTVRNDAPKKGHGWTSRGTYQADVRLDLEQVRQCRQFRMYKLTKADRV